MNQVNTLTIKSASGREGDAELTQAQTIALVQFLKRLTWRDFAESAIDEDEAFLIKDGITALQSALSNAGCAPR